MTNKAAQLVTGAKQWASHYGRFANGTEGAVLTVPLRVRGAWGSGDVDAIANVFTDDGSMLIGDRQLRGREEIRSYLGELFQSVYKGSRLEEEPVEIKMLTPDVALAVMQGGVVREGESNYAPENEVRSTWVVTRADGDWRLVSYQSSPLRG
ncbi:SgcJ/EcaC family oxidoreductase [Micromonospora sp. WMMD882]|uniref:SgcJ/EcaC family oxidoreductase n=1 Tax=Micromonospora sp. WMMD882 TaxID=3015151 RepID=UPI00248CEB6E|nr:SgcJ/EcaC family oxidoreductase [Micromonospora sp. WMMD882]WBB78698.1 SgcJ/EcaC family oxidoreductase [Micromonospora sp. WMMD882]